MNDPVFRLDGVTKAYHQAFSRTLVLDRVSFQVDPGEFVSIQGPSGSGKSTLLHIMGLLDEPSSGTLEFLGTPAKRLTAKQRTAIHREHIGFVFQAYHLIDDMTVYENLETPLLYRKIKGAERKSLIAELLDRFNIVAKKDLFPSQLSGGQQQLVGIARALIIKPTVILADEPTGNLHSSQGDMIMDILEELNRKDEVTIVQVTHNNAYAARGSRVIQLVDGRIKHTPALI